MTFKCKPLFGLLFIFTLHFLLPALPANADTVYTVNNNSSVSLIETSNDTFTGTIPLPFSAKPTAICLNTVSPHAYTLNSGDNTVSVIDTKNMSVVSTLTDTRFTGLTTIACDPTGTRVLIGNNDASGTTSSILYLNTATLALDSQETSVGKNPGSIVFNKNGSKAYVLNQGAPSISVIDTSSKLVESTTPLLESDLPYALAMHSQDSYLYVVNLLSNSVTIINPASMEIDPTPLTVGILPTALAVSNKTNILYVSDSYGTISLIDPATKSVTSFFTSESPLALIERNDGQRVYLASMSDNIIRSYDTVSLSSAPTTISLPSFSSPQGLATLQGTRHNLDLTITGNGSGNVNWPFSVSYPQKAGGTAGVPEGIAVTINATADSCSTVAWNVCDSASGGGTNSSFCLVNPFTVDKSVNAVFTKKVEHTITTSVSGEGGSINCPTQACEGANATCSITPTLGYELSSLKDNGSDILGSVTGGTVFQIQNILGAHSIEAGFALKTFTITASSDVNGAIAPSPQTVSYDNTTSFTLTPNFSYSLVAVSGCGGTVSGNIYTTGPIRGDCTVSAAFTPGSFTVTSQTPVGGGSISCLPSTVLSGGSSNCTITPNAGFHLETLNDSGTDKTLSVIGASYQITNITLPHDVVALFINSPPIANGQSVSTSQNQSRSITLTGSDVDGSSLNYSVISSPSHGLLSGIAPNLTYTPTEGYVGSDSFTFTVSDGVNNSIPAVITIMMVQVQKTVTFSAKVNGSLSGSTTQTVNWGDAATPVTATPTAGFHFAGWVDTNSFTTTMTNPLIVTNVKTDMAITANFANSPPTANVQSVTTPENQARTITLSGIDPEFSNLTYTIMLSPTHGILSGTAPNLTYTPTTDFVGDDSFTFTVSDGTNTAAPAIVYITVTQVIKTVNFFYSTGGTIIGITAQQINLYGSASTVTANSNPGYHFVNWTGTNGFAATTTNPLTLANVTTDMDITANFSHDPVDGICGADNGQILAALSPTILCSSGTASVVTGVGHPWSWSCDGQYGGTTPPLCSATVKQYIVSFTVPANGSVNDSTTQTLDYGAPTSAVTATASTDYHFVNWTGVGLTTSSSNPLTVANVTADLDITANFSRDPVDGACGADNLQVLASQTPTNLCSSGTASAITGSGHPWNWSCAGQYLGTTPPLCSATIKQYNISFAPPLNGTVSDSATQTIDYRASTAAVTATANPGYHFDNWTDTDGVVISSAATLTITNVTADLNVTANFSINPVIGACGTDNGQVLAAYTPTNLCLSGSTSAISGSGHPWSWNCIGQYGGPTSPCSATIRQYIITFTTTVNGSVSGSTAQTPDYGASTSAVTAYAGPGYHFTNWTGSGGFTATSNPLTVANVTADMTITANFVNSPPSANGQSLTIPENQTLDITLTGSDPEGSSLTYSVGAPSHGSLTGSTPNLTYTPTTGYVGPDSFIFSVSDGVNSSTPTTVGINVTQVTQNVSFTAGNNGTVTGTSPQTINWNSDASTVSANANTGYHFVNWTGTNGFTTKTANPLTITNVTADMDITANFSLAPINGACGTDNGNTLAALIPSNLCSSGRATTITGNGHPWSWSCEGQYGGTTPPSCFAAIKSYSVSFASPANGSIDIISTQQIDYGASTLAVTATADIGYHFVNWTGTGGFASSNINPLTVNNVTADIAISANFSATSVNGVCGADSGQILATVAPTNLCSSGSASAIIGSGHPWNWSCDGQYGGIPSPPCSATIKQYDISITPPLNGSVSGGTSLTLDYGTSASAITATATPGYHFVNWTGTNGFVTTTSNPLTVTNVTTNMSITANFNSSKYSTTTSIPGGNGSVSCTPASADFGTSVSCSITPNEGYQLAGLIDNGAVVQTSPDTTLHTISSINSNHSLAATFSLKSYEVTINSGANGRSTPSAAQNVIRGNVLSILLLPDAGYHVATPLNSSCSGTLSGTTFTTAAITSDCAITVEFEPNQYTLSATATSGGSITPATVPALHGSTTIFSVAPNTGYYTGSVIGCGGKLDGNIYTTGSITGDCSISATFVALPIVTASAFSSNGSITCTKPSISGDTVACLTTPDKGYHLATLTDNGVSVLSSVTSKNNYILNNISSSHDIAATFTPYTLDDALQALRYAVKIAAPKPDEYLWLDVAPIEADKPKGNGVIDIMDALVLLKHSIGSYIAW